jgi:hypothetical protein
MMILAGDASFAELAMLAACWLVEVTSTATVACME